MRGALLLLWLAPALASLAGRPSHHCKPVPPDVCAVAYDSSDCSGGWELALPEGRLAFRYFSSYWGYRNDMDLVAVRAGCLFTGFSSSDYSGNSVTVRADGGADKWVVFASDPMFQHIDEDIEAVICQCGVRV